MTKWNLHQENMSALVSSLSSAGLVGCLGPELSERLGTLGCQGALWKGAGRWAACGAGEWTAWLAGMGPRAGWGRVQ